MPQLHRVKHLFNGLGRTDPLGPLRHRRRRLIFSDKEVLDALKANDGNIQDTAAALPLGASQVKEIARKHGVYDKSKQRKPKGSGRAKTEIDLEQVMIRRAEGETMASIARSMGVSSSVIYVRLKALKHKQGQ